MHLSMVKQLAVKWAHQCSRVFQFTHACLLKRAVLLCVLLCPLLAFGQTTSLISGTVKDPSGGVVPSATVTLTNTLTNTQNTTTSNRDGIYSFPSLVAGQYTLHVDAPDFSRFEQQGIKLEINQSARVDVAMKLGSVQSQITVNANASPLQFDSITQETDISPEVEQKLPVLVNGAPRNATTFVALLPGVASNNGTSNESQIRINGGVVQGQEAIVDGVSLQEGALSQGGTIAFGDFPFSPDMISEVKVLALNYGPQYGGTSSGVITETTKSGTKDFHGSAFEYLRNTDLNATRFGASKKNPDNEHDFGGNIGGPIRLPKVPFIYSPRNKAFFFFNYEQYDQKGGVNPPVITIPTIKNRAGDFTDQVNGQGKLIPIYDPATTVANPNGTYTRKQFMGCDGAHPNVICPNRISPIAQAFNSFLPQPTNSNPVNNYQVPQARPDPILAGLKQFFIKIDDYVGQSDHVAVSIWHETSPQKFDSELPEALSYDQIFGDPENSWVNRLNWDHTFSATLLNHFAFGYLNRNEAAGSLNYKYTNQLPQIPGVAGAGAPPYIVIGGYASYGSPYGDPSQRIDHRPTYIANDLLTLVKGTHTISLGGEFRYLTVDATSGVNEAGTFNFYQGQTGLIGVPSGNSVASFLLGAVSSASSTYRSVNAYHGRQHAASAFAGDVWKATNHLTLNYGLRWEFWSPGTEANGNNSWTDLSRINPSAGGRPGAIVFGTSRAGIAYAGTHAPENLFYKGFAPRLGFIYAPDGTTTIRAGYSITFDQLFYTDYSVGASEQTGFTSTPSYSSTGNGGLNPAFYLSQGFPGNSNPLPDFDLGLGNGGLNSAPWRNPKDGRLPYSQQWNMAIEHAFSQNTSASITYVGTKGTHLYSSLDPANIISLSHLSLGNHLYDTFQPGQTQLDGVTIPYPGWVEQMQGCLPSVAQALLPYPQFCQSLSSLTENHGYSIYHSLQLAAQKRYTNGLYLLANFTWSKLIGTPGNEFGANIHNYLFGLEQRQRYYALSADDLPFIFNFAGTYTLPFGRGQHFLNKSRLVDLAVGGWEIADVTHINSGNLVAFAASCNTPGQFEAGGCFPELVSGQKIKAASQSQINRAIATHTAYSAFNKNAFVGANFPIPYQYQFTIPNGPLYSGLRGFAYLDSDFSLHKTFNVSERVGVKVGASFFNVFNQHTLGTSFGNGLTGTNFGQWAGGVSNPRNGQVDGRITF